MSRSLLSARVKARTFAGHVGCRRTVFLRDGDPRWTGYLKRARAGLAALGISLGLWSSPPCVRAESPTAPLIEPLSPVDDSRVFGARGELIVSADRLLPWVSYSSQTVTATQGDVTTKTTDSGGSLAFFVGREPALGALHTVPRLAVDFTILRNLTLGTSLAFAVGLGGVHREERTSPTVDAKTDRDGRAPQSMMLGFAPRLGYVIHGTPHLAFWARAGLSFYANSSKSEETSNLGVTSTSRVSDALFSLDVDPLLVWSPIPHVMVMAGPLLNVSLSGSHDTTFSQSDISKERSDGFSIFHIGFSTGLGTWFDL